MHTYVIVFRGEPSAGGYPIAITGETEPVRAALKAGMRHMAEFAKEVEADPSMRARSQGGMYAIEAALAELGLE